MMMKMKDEILLLLMNTFAAVKLLAMPKIFLSCLCCFLMNMMMNTMMLTVLLC
jgi:hypothetical protein